MIVVAKSFQFGISNARKSLCECPVMLNIKWAKLKADLALIKEERIKEVDYQEPGCDLYSEIIFQF